MKYVVCYSGGHSSALCAIETVRKAGAENVILLNHDINARVENQDIKRFKAEVAAYLGVPITPANMEGFEEKDQFDVCMEIKAFKCGNQSSALCTNRLKTDPFRRWLSENYPASAETPRNDITIIYGFDKNEPHRIKRRFDIMAASGYKCEFPIAFWERTIQNVEEIGIKRPSTYEIHKHANCIGCLKGGKQHWYVVYCLYPEIFEKAKIAEEAIGYSILRGGYLKEHEKMFCKMADAGVVPTENIIPQRFWSEAKKKIAKIKEDVK